MKANLLRKVRKEVKIYQRNNFYYVVSKYYEMSTSCKSIEDAKAEYRRNVIWLANYLFGRKYKRRIL